MAISTTITRVDYAGDDAALSFVFPFAILSTDQLAVVTLAADGTETALWFGTDYLVNDGPWPAGGTITLGAAVPSGTTIILRRVTEITQPTSYRAQATFYPDTIEASLDRLTMCVQELSNLVRGDA
jgi:hypothetical protein